MGTWDAITEVFLGSKTLDLRVVSSRQFLHGVSRGASRQHPDDHRIELHCLLHHSLGQGAIVVGKCPWESESLGDIEFTLELRSAQKVFSEFDEKNPDFELGKNAVGILMYNAPISPDSLAGLPSSVIEKSKTGSINGWIFYGDRSLAKISRLLMAEPRQEIHIWATVKATPTATPLCLTYETKMHHQTSYRWDAKDSPLEVTEVCVVVTTAAEPAEGSATPEPMVSATISTVSEAIIDSIRSLDTKVGRLGWTIVVALGALLNELWRRP